jgi:hypothetical protein
MGNPGLLEIKLSRHSWARKYNAIAKSRIELAGRFDNVVEAHTWNM